MEKFRTQPRPYQLEIYNKSKDAAIHGLFLAPGLGKTKIIVDTAYYLYDQGEIHLLIVIAPKGVYAEWPPEIAKHMHESVSTNTALWKPAQSKLLKHKLDRLCLPKSGIYALDIFIGNTDMLSTRKGVAYLEKLLTAHGANCLMVIDESTRIANRKSLCSKAAIKLGRLAKYKRILTGTPVADSIMELPAQVSFLGDIWDLLRVKNWYAFRNCYCILEIDYFGSRVFHRVIGTRRMDQLIGHLDKFCSIMSREQANPDLPPQIYQKYSFEMTKEQKSYYKQMRDKFKVELGELGPQVAVNIVLAKIMKLRQIACGFIYDNEKNVTRFKHNRIDELLELIELNAGKIIVWSNFIPCIEEICNAIGNKFGQGSLVRYDGSSVDRDSLVSKFSNDPDCRFFIGNQSVGGYGITLTSGNTMIFYSNSYSYKTRVQAEGRSTWERRATQGIAKEQNRSTLIIDMVATGTVDNRLLDILKSKEHTHNMVMGSSQRLIDLMQEEL